MNNIIEKEQHNFMTCSYCKKVWEYRDKFLNDSKIQMIGYLADLECLERGLFYFNHKNENCGTTLTVETINFIDLYDGPIYTEKKTGGEECPEYCLYKENLEKCPAKCKCSYIREIVQIVKNG